MATVNETNKVRIRSGVGLVGGFTLSLGVIVALAAPRFHNASASAEHLKNPYAGQAAAAKAGATLFAHDCSSCHGNNGQGMGKMSAVRSGATQSAPDGQLFWFITTGAIEKRMPPWGSLPEQQRWQIVTYLKSLSVSETK